MPHHTEVWARSVRRSSGWGNPSLAQSLGAGGCFQTSHATFLVLLEQRSQKQKRKSKTAAGRETHPSALQGKPDPSCQWCRAANWAAKRALRVG